MPIYQYECNFCRNSFDEFRSINEKNGKSYCPKCGNVSFKVPAVFNTKIFKKRIFSDGTSTPDYVSTPKQEKAWMKSEGITYDAPTVKRYDVKKENKRKSETVMEVAFAEAMQKVNQGYKIEKPKQRRKTNALRFKV